MQNSQTWSCAECGEELRFTAFPAMRLLLLLFFLLSRINMLIVTSFLLKMSTYSMSVLESLPKDKSRHRLSITFLFLCRLWFITWLYIHRQYVLTSPFPIWHNLAKLLFVLYATSTQFCTTCKEFGLLFLTAE